VVPIVSIGFVDKSASVVFVCSYLKPKFHYADFATFTKTSLQRKSRTQIMKVHDTNHVADFHDLCRDLCPRQSLWTLSPTFPVHCNGPNSIRVTQTGLSRTCHGLCRKHLDMLRLFLSATFMIYVRDFHRNFMISCFVTICVCDFHDFCPRFSPRGSFGESRHNGIWVLIGCTASLACLYVG